MGSDLDKWAQDPAVFGRKFAKIARATLRIRYSLLPYLYTLFFESHVHGNTVVRSLMHEFTSDQQTHGIDTAFLWGPAFMIAPVLQEGARSVDVYFPEAQWFDYYTGHKLPSTWNKNYATVPAPLSKIPLFIRGGYILPEQAPATTTTKSRLNPFGLIIALDEQGKASGSLFWDDGDSIDTIEKENYFLAKYTYSKGHLKTEILKNGYRGADSLEFKRITILGLKRRPYVVALNGRAIRGYASSYELSGKLTLWISAPLTRELNLVIY
ncbi:probable maltase-glucoamylase 2 [Lathamus discolor]|uniref:probable maltase-glucoamylase 2 n=1 Tax=Lathamus discolor TaxID=678569 RepID=UPI0032B79BCF